MLVAMFTDRVKIHVRAGDGGNGCVSFRREKYVEHGGPDGGDGGKGGDVILVADPNVHDLTDFHFAPRVAAKHGGHGSSKNRFGRKAPDVVLKVPVGTLVYRLAPAQRVARPSKYHPAAATERFDATVHVGLPYGSRQRRPATPQVAVAAEAAPLPPDRELLADLVEPGQRLILARGGRGGRGNAAFKSPTHQAPREFEYGEPGEELDAELILKTIADVGLVGYPNAGKSTLLAKLTAARPKIAPYPFTTLSPNVGIIIYDDFHRVRVADIPGLIEGAHEGRGLGHEFLRHIERCGLLLVLLDMAGTDNRDPREDYRQLLTELQLHDPKLLQKPRLVVANKMDLPAAKKNLAALKRSLKIKPVPISALTGDGVDKLKLAIRAALP